VSGRETDALRSLADMLREQGGLLGGLLADEPAIAGETADRAQRAGRVQTASGPSAAGDRPARPSPAQLTASGPSAAGDRSDRPSPAQLAASGPSAAEDRPARPSPAQLAASGPRAARARAEYELLVEAIYEGYLLHYGVPRVIAAADPDLLLLAGDRLYALGLARLVELGDGEAVAELADTITLSSLAHAAGESELAGAVWEAGARAVGWGSSNAHKHAKQLARAGSAEALEAMRTSAGGDPASP